MIGLTKTGSWETCRRILSEAPKRVKDAARKALLQEGQLFRNKIVQGIREQSPGGRDFAPLAETTLAKRQFAGFSGTKALIRRGDLRNSIVSVPKEGGDAVFVGLLRTAIGSDGQSLVNVGDIHEFGRGPFVIRVTQKMIRYLAAVFGGLQRASTSELPASTLGVIVVRIPARPFIRPVWEMYGQPADVANRYMRRFANLLNGQLGFLGPMPPTR